MFVFIRFQSRFLTGISTPILVIPSFAMIFLTINGSGCCVSKIDISSTLILNDSVGVDIISRGSFPYRYYQNMSHMMLVLMIASRVLLLNCGN